MYTQWVATGDAGDLQKFQSACAEARQVVCAAKDVWFQAKDEEAQKERFSGSVEVSPRHAMGHGDCYHPDQAVSAMKMAAFAQHCQNNISGGTDTLPRC